jgi:hypothetical protein
VYSFKEIAKRFGSLLRAGSGAPLSTAEQELRQLTQHGLEHLAKSWEMSVFGVQMYLSYTYNSIGLFHLKRGQSEYRITKNIETIMEAAQNAERCHEQALDVFDMAADDILLLPDLHPISVDEAREYVADFQPIGKNFIFTFWGLGISKYILKKHVESRKYLRYCLMITPEDEQSTTWQSDASNYLHKLEKKRVTVKLHVKDTNVYLMEPEIIQAKGDVVAWDSYARPMLPEYKIWFDSESMSQADVVRLLLMLEGRVVTLQTDETGDLFRPLFLVDVENG